MEPLYDTIKSDSIWYIDSKAKPPCVVITLEKHHVRARRRRCRGMACDGQQYASTCVGRVRLSVDHVRMKDQRALGWAAGRRRVAHRVCCRLHQVAMWGSTLCKDGGVLNCWEGARGKA